VKKKLVALKRITKAPIEPESHQMAKFTQFHPTYLSTLKICSVKLCTELFHAIIPIPFYAFCWSAIPTSCYIFNVFYSCGKIIARQRCMFIQ